MYLKHLQRCCVLKWCVGAGGSFQDSSQQPCRLYSQLSSEPLRASCIQRTALNKYSMADCWDATSEFSLPKCPISGFSCLLSLREATWHIVTPLCRGSQNKKMRGASDQRSARNGGPQATSPGKIEPGPKPREWTELLLQSGLYLRWPTPSLQPSLTQKTQLRS